MPKDPRQERREKMLGDKPAIGTGINTTPASQLSVFTGPAANDTRNQMTNPMNSSFETAPVKYKNAYNDVDELPTVNEQADPQMIDPRSIQRSKIHQPGIVAGGRIHNGMPYGLQQQPIEMADQLESGRLSTETAMRGPGFAGPGAMGLSGTPAAHMDQNMFVDMNMGRMNSETTASVDAQQLVPGSTPTKIQKPKRNA